VGVWKINPAKSTYTTDHPAPKSLTATIQEQPNGIVVDDAVGEDAKGNPIHAHYAAKFDGKDYPLSGTADRYREHKADRREHHREHKKEKGASNHHDPERCFRRRKDADQHLVWQRLQGQPGDLDRSFRQTVNKREDNAQVGS
jgi:hypothetical protein